MSSLAGLRIRIYEDQQSHTKSGLDQPEFDTILFSI